MIIDVSINLSTQNIKVLNSHTAWYQSVVSILEEILQFRHIGPVGIVCANGPGD